MSVLFVEASVFCCSLFVCLLKSSMSCDNIITLCWNKIVIVIICHRLIITPSFVNKFANRTISERVLLLFLESELVC